MTELKRNLVPFDAKQTLAAQLAAISKASKTSWTPENLLNVFAFMFMAFPHHTGASNHPSVAIPYDEQSLTLVCKGCVR